MTNCLKLNPFDPIARGATPMPPVGSSSYAHKTRRTARSRLSVVDELKFIIDDGIVCYRRQRQPAVPGGRAVSIGCPSASGAWIERP
jgi:hypothetical protein